MATLYIIKKSNGDYIVPGNEASSTIYPNESVGPSPGATGSPSTPFQVGCRYDIAIVSLNTGTLILAGNVATLFTVGFKFVITGSSVSNGTYTVATSTYNLGLNQTFITASGLLTDPTPGTAQLQVFTVAGDQTQPPNRFVSGFSFQINDPSNSSAIDNGTYTVLSGSHAVYDSVSTYTAIPVAGPIAASSPFVNAEYQLTYTLNAPSVLDMVGQDSLNWGAKIWENMVRMVENFAYTSSPDVNPNIGTNTPLFGQIWFDTTTSAGEYKYWNGTAWSPISDAIGPFPGGVVNQIIAGTNVTISPTGGTGDVTINATGNVLQVSGTANQTVVSPTTGDVVVGLASNLIVPTPSSGIALTVNGNTSGTSTAVAIKSPFSSVSTSPLLTLQSTAAGGLAMLSLSGNGTFGTDDFSIFQNGSTFDASILNRANGHLYLGTNDTDMLTLFADGGMTIGNPSGGDKGSGTINAQNLYINGVAVGANAGTVTSIQIASGNSALTSSGGPIVTMGTITLTVNPSVVAFLANNNSFAGTQSFNTINASTIGATTVNATNVNVSSNVATASLTATGNITANGNITAYNSSDISLKKNIKNITSALDKVSQLNGVEFDWTEEYIQQNGGEDGYHIRRHDVGVIAQEVELVLPEVVATRIDGTKAVKYDKLVALLIEAIKDLKVEIDTLKGK